MDARTFLTTADQLARGATEADWRSAVSRAYYAVFHVARQLFTTCGFTVPRADRAHSYLWLRLCNSGDTTVQRAGANIDALRRLRNHADYDVDRPLLQATALTQAQNARSVLQALDAAAREPLRTQITDAMKIYERDVLKDVTWRP
jgi:uncharacterized protein (UPF0332 family)